MSEYLVADIGGTNARFAIADSQGGLHNVDRLPTADYEQIDDAIRAYLERYQVKVTRAAIAIANPVVGDQIKMTNHHWSFSIKALQERLQLSHLNVMNDFTAQAFALPVLRESDLQCIKTGGNDPHGMKLVIGPGTGLGVSGLIPAAGQWVALSGDGGHVSAVAMNDHEWQIIQYARRFYPDHVSAERLVCGSGLSLIDAALRNLTELSQAKKPAEITQAALNGDSHSLQVVHQYLNFLATTVADAALTLGAWSGVYLCGGVLPKIAGLLAESDFVVRFLTKGRLSSCLKEIPIYLVLDDQQSGLKGAAFALMQESAA